MIKTVISIETGEMLYSTLAEVNLQEGEILVPEIPNKPLVKAYFNFEKREFYEGATQSEIEAFTNRNQINAQQRILDLENELQELKANK
jgi:hypothetical protein